MNIEKNYLNKNELEQIENIKEKISNKTSNDILLEMISIINKLKKYVKKEDSIYVTTYDFPFREIIETYFSILKNYDDIDYNLIYDKLFCNNLNYDFCHIFYNNLIENIVKERFQKYCENPKYYFEKYKEIERSGMFFIQKYINNYIFENQKLNELFLDLVLYCQMSLMIPLINGYIDCDKNCYCNYTKNYLDSIFNEIKNEDSICDDKKKTIVIKFVLIFRQYYTTNFHHKISYAEYIREEIFNYFSNNFKDEELKRNIFLLLMDF